VPGGERPGRLKLIVKLIEITAVLNRDRNRYKDRNRDRRNGTETERKTGTGQKPGREQDRNIT